MEAAIEMSRLVREERAVLIFDGLDEKSVHMTPAEARAFIRVLWQSLPEEWHKALMPSRSGRDGRPSLESDRSDLRGFLRSAQSSPGHPSSTGHPSSPRKPTTRQIISCRSHDFRDLETETSMLTGVFDGDVPRATAAFDLISSIYNLGEPALRP